MVDDDSFITRTLQEMICPVQDIECVGTAANGFEAISSVAELSPDLVLMDVAMPGMGGVEATREILRRENPPRVLMWTTFEFDNPLKEALAAGARGFLLKSATAESLYVAIRATMQGLSILDAEPARHVAQALARVDPLRIRLTKRELAVLRLIIDGASNAAIARDIFVSEGTVKNTVSALKDKLQVSTRAQLIAKGLDLPELSDT